MHCSQCGAAIAADAKFCGRCGHPAATGSVASGASGQDWSKSKNAISSKNWGCLAALGIIAALYATGQCSSEPPKEQVAAVDPAPCDRTLSALEATGLVKDRPAANRIDVDELLWAAMPAKQKRLVGLAVRCSALRGAIGREDFDSYAVVYGYRSGKRLAMATHVGVSLE